MTILELKLKKIYKTTLSVKLIFNFISGRSLPVA